MECPSSSTAAADPMEEEILKMLNDDDSSVRQQALIILHESAKKYRRYRISLCSQRILGKVVSMLHTPLPPKQTFAATAFITILSEELSNRFKIVQSGAISVLVNLLKNHSATLAAVRALANLSLGEGSKESMSSTLVISGLLEYSYEPGGNHRGREYALSLLRRLYIDNPDTLARLSETISSAQKLLELALDTSSSEAKILATIAKTLICGLAGTRKGREALMDAGAVGGIVRMMRKGEENEVPFLHTMHQMQTSQDTRDLFQGLAISAGAEEVLLRDKERWMTNGKYLARSILTAIREHGHESVKGSTRERNESAGGEEEGINEKSGGGGSGMNKPEEERADEKEENK